MLFIYAIFVFFVLPILVANIVVNSIEHNERTKPHLTKEEKRLQKISLLSISNEEKQLVINKAIYIGMPKEALELSFGCPHSISINNTPYVSNETWTYYSNFWQWLSYTPAWNITIKNNLVVDWDHNVS